MFWGKKTLYNLQSRFTISYFPAPPLLSAQGHINSSSTLPFFSPQAAGGGEKRGRGGGVVERVDPFWLVVASIRLFHSKVASHYIALALNIWAQTILLS